MTTDPTRIVIAYYSGTGHTHLMAEAIADGIRHQGNTDATLLRIVGAQITEGRWQDDEGIRQLEGADAIIFGSPTYMGSAAAQFKAFADWSSELWIEQKWADKLAGGFTHGAGLSGDKLNTLIYFSILAGQHSMTWINPALHDYTNDGTSVETNRMGSYLGVMGQAALDFSRQEAELHPADREGCLQFGQRMAEWTHRVR